ELLATEENYDERRLFVLKIDKILKNKWLNYDIKSNLFGSSETKLATAKSDIDICITTKNDGLIDIYMLKEVLENCKMQNIRCMNTRVPIIKFQNPTSCDPPILPVLQIQQCGGSIFINKPLQKGFKNNESIGELLLKFFKYFAYEFDYRKSVISLRQGKYLTKKEKNWGYQNLCVEEPINTERNLGNSMTYDCFKKLREELYRAFAILNKSLNLKYCCLSYKLNEIYYMCEQNNGLFKLITADKDIY
ncbi:24080_t:CDS:2, partial [Dentiscutata erythropus]